MNEKAVLKRFTPCETSAQRGYIKYCEMYGWDISQKGKFGMMKWLFASCVTPEGYSVWFISHSNLTKSKGGTWTNEITGDLIIETWDEPMDNIYIDVEDRVVFAKIRGVYLFLGVYRAVDLKINESGKYVKTYKLVKSTYPN